MTESLRQRLDEVTPDCGDSSCRFAVKKGGMRTNGGCRCLSTRSWMAAPPIEKYAYVAHVYIDALEAEKRELLDRIEKLEGKLLADQINAAPHPHLVIEAVAALVDRRAKQRPWVARQFEDLAYDIRKMKK